MSGKIRQAVEDARFTLDLAILTAWDALLTAGEWAKRAAETLVGSLILYVAAVVLIVTASAGITFTSFAGALVYVAMMAVTFFAIVRNLPAARATRRDIEAAREGAEEAVQEARVKSAETLGYFRGYDDGWTAHKRLTDYYENLAYVLHGEPTEDDED